MKLPFHIEIVSSTSTKLSSMNNESRETALVALSKHFTTVGITIVNNLQDLEALVARRPDLVFLGMKYIDVQPGIGGSNGEKVWLPSYLDQHHIRHTGSSQSAHELERSKHLAKERVLEAGLSTAAYIKVSQKQPLKEQDVTLNYPVFVKPLDRGGGIGVDHQSVAINFNELIAKVVSISQNYAADSLVEEYLPGREFSVAVLKDRYSGRYFTMPIELVAEKDVNGHRMLSKKVKNANSETVLHLAEDDVCAAVNRLALDVFHALGARDYGRIDIRLDAYGKPHFLETNLIPSLIDDYGSFPKACWLNGGMNHEAVVLHIARLGLAHKKTLPVARRSRRLPLLLTQSMFAADAAADQVLVK